MTITSGTRKVAVIRVPSSYRRLLFSVPWNSHVRGRLRPGTYQATLQMNDTLGRIVTATQSVYVVKSGIVGCV